MRAEIDELRRQVKALYARVGKYSGSGGCRKQNHVVDFAIHGFPTGGSLVIYHVHTQEEFELEFDADNAAITAGFEGLTFVGAGEAVVTGDHMTRGTISVEFQGSLANTNVGRFGVRWGTLSGGAGVGAVVSYPQVGHSRNLYP